MRLIYVGEFAREFPGVGTFEPGQRTRHYDYPGGDQGKVENMLKTGLFMPYDKEAEELVKGVLEELRQLEELKKLDDLKQLEDLQKLDDLLRQAEEAAAKEAEETKPLPEAAVKILREREGGELIGGDN